MMNKPPLPEFREHTGDRYLQTNLKSLWVGGLIKHYSYNTGPVPEKFLERLALFCFEPATTVFGPPMPCPLCSAGSPAPDFPDVKSHIIMDTPYGILTLGFSEIRIPGKGNIAYAAYDMIYHYIVDHHYQPPQEFIDAVLDAPEPNSEEFKKFLKPWREPYKPDLIAILKNSQLLREMIEIAKDRKKISDSVFFSHLRMDELTLREKCIPALLNWFLVENFAANIEIAKHQGLVDQATMQLVSASPELQKIFQIKDGLLTFADHLHREDVLGLFDVVQRYY